MERSLKSNDVTVLSLPVAFGKTLFADAITRWSLASTGGNLGGSAIVLHPNNALVNQFTDQIPGFTALHRQDSYTCVHDAHGQVRPCKVVGEERGFCKDFGGGYHGSGGCPYIRALRSARTPGGKVTCNYHSYLAHKLQDKSLVIVDEAHLLPKVIAEMEAVTLWRPVHGWRRTLYNIDDVLSWLGDVPEEDILTDERLSKVRDVVTGRLPGYTITCGTDSLRGKETECIKVIPILANTSGNAFFPNLRQRIVLMSATISSAEVEELGLSGRRVGYITAPSGIPAENRPFVYIPVAPMTRRHRDLSLRKVADYLVDTILPKHPTERGLVHAPYALARDLMRYIGSHPRLIGHDLTSKADTLRHFLEIHDGDNRVLIGSGMYEGLDLRYDLARFQVLTVTPRLSLADPGNSWLLTNRPDIYQWRTLRDLIQAYGRVCRSPQDYGITYLLDSTGDKELNLSITASHFPWFIDALHMESLC